MITTTTTTTISHMRPLFFEWAVRTGTFFFSSSFLLLVVSELCVRCSSFDPLSDVYFWRERRASRIPGEG